MGGMGEANRLGEYLKARRAQVTPADVGLPPGGNRRVPGLRREEVAWLAGLSTDYYTRLEQGREQRPSASVLNALARTLLLEADAQQYLFAIAVPGPQAPARRGGGRLPEGLTDLIDEWSAHPVVVADECYRVVAANQLGRALYAGHAYSDDLARLVFLDPGAAGFYRDWSAVASSTVAGIRASATRDPDDTALTALVGDLSVRSPEFASRWAKGEVREKTSGALRLRHPVVGGLDLGYQTFRPGAAPGLLLKVYRAAPGTETADNLAVLGSLTAPPAEASRRRTDTPPS